VRLAIAVAIALAIAPSLAHARCNGHERARWSVHQALVMLLNPMGAEHGARFALCVPLYPSEDGLLSENHFEVGASTYLAPIFALAGGFVQFGPATFVYVRAEVHAQAIWPLPLAGSGYYPRSGYRDPWGQASTPADRGQSATGWSLRLTSIWRGHIDLSPVVGLFAIDALWVDYDEIGGASHWVNVRNDLITARGDWIVANELAVVMSVRTAGPELRFGVYDATRYVPASGYGNHQLGPLVMMAWDLLDTHVASLDLFARLGVYTHHAFRGAQLSTMLGMSIDWDLGGV
jgi:hypothetical protein